MFPSLPASTPEPVKASSQELGRFPKELAAVCNCWLQPSEQRMLARSLVLLVVTVASISLATAQTDCAQGDDDGGGHFISASISWRKLQGNTVRFEIISTWRRDFRWSASALSQPSVGPVLGDELPILGLAFQDVPTDCARQESAGGVSIAFSPGNPGRRDIVATCSCCCLWIFMCWS